MSALRCPRATIWKASCKRRDCEACGPRWARDWRRVMFTNLEAYPGPVVLVSITAPGTPRLPWDEAHCSHRRPHKHRGPSGCRVEDRAAREWSELAPALWGAFRRAAAVHTRRHAGRPVALLERVWEPQKRGVPHLHLVLGFAPEDQAAARAFTAYLKEHAETYDFGFVDGRLKVIAAADAARYLASYLTGRSRRKGSIRENIADPRMPRSLVWLTPKLTRRTLVTMRMLRRVRHLWAAARGHCAWPNWRDVDECFRVRLVYRQFYGERAPPPPVLAPA